MDVCVLIFKLSSILQFERRFISTTACLCSVVWLLSEGLTLWGAAASTLQGQISLSGPSQSPDVSGHLLTHTCSTHIFTRTHVLTYDSAQASSVTHRHWYRHRHWCTHAHM